MLSRLIGEDEFTASEVATGSFGIDRNAATKLRRRGEGRLSAFAGTAGALAGQEGITGLGSVST
jgi:hypothetical protein